jgi:hypothetical protein
MEELKKGVTAHVRNMQHQLPGVLDIVGEIIENEEEVSHFYARVLRLCVRRGTVACAHESIDSHLFNSSQRHASTRVARYLMHICVF